jgi:hypothetical protein
MNGYFLLFAVRTRGGDRVDIFLDDDERPRVFKTEAEALEWARGSGVCKVNGCKIVPIAGDWVFP